MSAKGKKIENQEMTHTPGPWCIYAEDELPGQVAIREKDNPNHGRVIAVLDASDEQDEANARLIAAAPELLKCAKLALTSTTELCGEDIEFIKAIIVKAEGRA